MALKVQAQKSRARFCIWLTGDTHWVHQQAQDLLSGETSAVYIGAATPTWAQRSLSAQHAIRLLGQEARYLVYDAYSGVNPDTLGQIAGLVEKGGLFILLSAPPESPIFWQDPEKERLCITPDGADAVGNVFLQHTWQVLKHDVAVMRCDQRGGVSDVPAIPVTFQNHACDAEQQQVVEQLYQQIMSDQWRAGVLTAARGRGKSAALGLLAKRLSQHGWKVAMTAPAVDTLASVREHAGAATPTFIPLSDVTTATAQSDLLLVDEAAMVPVARLRQIVKAYPKVIFSTTTQGYEGTGQGFALRFMPWLQQQTTTAEFRLHMPIRWLPNDPLEALFNRWLLLDAAQPRQATFVSHQPLSIHQLKREDVLSQPALLSAIFGLLINAHYRTTPGDLRVMLDSPNISIWVASQEGCLLGTCLMAEEGALTPALNQAIWDGTRRPRGHLLPQLLVAQEGHQDAGAFRFARVVRIAVVDEVRQQGVARHLLDAIETHFKGQGVDHIGASFAASKELLAFWRAQSYACVRVGTAVDVNSGSVAVTVLKPLQRDSANALAQWRAYYLLQLPYLFGAWLSGIDADIHHALGQDLLEETACLDDALLWQRLQGFAYAKRSPESSAFSVNALLTRHPHLLERLPEPLALLSRDFVQTPHQLETLTQRYRLSGRKALINRLREAAQALCHLTSKG